jgi:hypothetical protein
MCVGFALLAIHPIIHPLELLVLLPLAYVVSPRFRWLVPIAVIAFPIAVSWYDWFVPSPRAWADRQLAITRSHLPLTADEQSTLWRQYYDYKRQ